MRLRNKKTGEIVEVCRICPEPYEARDFNCKSLSELNEEWEDVPKEAKEYYWYIDDLGVVSIDKVQSSTITVRKNFGNYFHTREEAEKAVEKLKAWKRLKDKGFRITLQGCKGYAWLQANWEDLQGDYSDVLFLFGGEE